MTTPRAFVYRDPSGQLVLDDPDALAVMRAVEKHNCKATLAAHKDRVAHFASRIAERGLSGKDVVIVLGRNGTFECQECKGSLTLVAARTATLTLHPKTGRLCIEEDLKLEDYR